MTLDLDLIMKALSIKRPVFHSEADFQHALAWEFHKQYPSFQIRLEYPQIIFARKAYVDLWFFDEENKFAIE